MKAVLLLVMLATGAGPSEEVCAEAPTVGAWKGKDGACYCAMVSESAACMAALEPVVVETTDPETGAAECRCIVVRKEDAHLYR